MEYFKIWMVLFAFFVLFVSESCQESNNFWNNNFVGKVKGNQELKQKLRPGEARMLSIHEAVNYPPVYFNKQASNAGFSGYDRNSSMG